MSQTITKGVYSISLEDAKARNSESFGASKRTRWVGFGDGSTGGTPVFVLKWVEFGSRSEKLEETHYIQLVEVLICP